MNTMSSNTQQAQVIPAQISNTASQRINVALLGRALDSEKCDEYLVSQHGAVKYRDAYLLSLPQGEAWLFEYAVLVCWGVKEDDRRQLVEMIKPIILDPLSVHFIEQFSYHIEEGQAFKIHNDVVSLPAVNQLTLLALSHAFAQSSKLVFFEEQAENVIRENTYLSKELARSGSIPLSRRKLARLRGQLFDTSSDISLHFNLLDTPEFFWNYPDQEEFYIHLSKYLDLQPRIDILNHKLETIHSLLDMLANEQHHKHSAFLEWIIIILIAIDILIYFFPRH
ncbi:hypothetical protein TDB9533_04103 [Thalassocella blandensis]|nr:hypothetical protein TDB9533_04103 [Thalassocella blandensis]